MHEQHNISCCAAGEDRGEGMQKYAFTNVTNSASKSTGFVRCDSSDDVHAACALQTTGRFRLQSQHKKKMSQHKNPERAILFCKYGEVEPDDDDDKHDGTNLIVVDTAVNGRTPRHSWVFVQGSCGAAAAGVFRRPFW